MVSCGRRNTMYTGGSFLCACVFVETMGTVLLVLQYLSQKGGFFLFHFRLFDMYEWDLKGEVVYRILRQLYTNNPSCSS